MATIFAMSSGFWCWGDNSGGVVGVGTYSPTTFTVTPDRVTSPASVASIAGAKRLDATWGATYSILGGSNDGVLMGWGHGSFLGSGQDGLFPTPARIGGSTLFTAVNGSCSTCAITSTGTVLCWGSDSAGQVGPNGSGTFVRTPVQVPGIQNATAIACGADACYAVVGPTEIKADERPRQCPRHARRPRGLPIPRGGASAHGLIPLRSLSSILGPGRMELRGSVHDPESRGRNRG